MDYDSRLSDISKRREPSILRELVEVIHAAPKGTISFATGMPNPSTFPFAEVSVKMKTGEEFTLAGSDLDAALQYQSSTGIEALRGVLQELIDEDHGVQDWDTRCVLVSSGSMDGIARAMDMLVNEGDPVVVQHPLFVGIETMLSPYKPEYIHAEQDRDGIIPSALRQTLENRKRSGKKMPKVLYVNPTGANPTGTTLTTDRKREIYKLAQDFDLIILEDDAYYYLHFFEDNPTSILSMDTDGRVIRFDSFSKVLSAGLRLGIVTGPKILVRQIDLHMQSSIMHTSSMAQVLAHQLFQVWGIGKLKKHFANVRAFYKERRDIMIQAAEKHLIGLAQWSLPTGGMFLWIKVNNVKDTSAMVLSRGLDKKILLVPGRFFHTDTQKGSPYIRASFSVSSPDEIDEGMARLAAIIRSEKTFVEMLR
ncbi:Kynurenine/alpha-aminoadipate aminotransferase, mitochondrial [Frankliniella fusca]|uniref:Kynurenine/alpha-aminoadipate aminotransferase, mitochondrial n=1 Tax=Frankliniella fusca TaxID=407009 RepID=A0AAE1LNS3_9NEOP|nr:Kynurenine/alpha-aminoadipate aminotransferase, mitochondrial [Frankliniella fusca]